MREIKFRVWHKEKKIIREVCEVSFAGGYVILEGFGSFGAIEAPIRDVELIQYTGVNDKNGKEIYTGFFVRWGLRVYEICFDCGFYMRDLSRINPDYPITKEFKKASDEFEVIGNIYENPEILKDKQWGRD